MSNMLFRGARLATQAGDPQKIVTVTFNLVAFKDSYKAGELKALLEFDGIIGSTQSSAFDTAELRMRRDSDAAREVARLISASRDG